MTEVYEGQRFKFTVTVPLGSGGMGAVHLGSRVDDPAAVVAIKTPREGLPPQVAEVFLREAEAAARIVHPNVIAVVDWGDTPKQFIAFEFAPGGSLDREIARREGGQDPWSEEALIMMYRQMVAGMKAINAEVIHRDLKPANIFLDGAQIKIADFGLAKYVGEVTRSNSFKGGGTARYMAPETIAAESQDWRSDQYTLGVVFFELAALHVPFEGSPADLARQHLYARAPRLNDVAIGISVRLGTLVARMLEKGKDQRFQTWDAIDAELDAIVKLAPAGASPVIEDPLASEAARQVEAVKARELARQKVEDDKRAEHANRQDLLRYWGEQFFSEIRTRIAGLAASGAAIEVKERPTPGQDRVDRRTLEAYFLHARFGIDLEVLPSNAPPELLAWGTIEVETGKRCWYANLLLTKAPEPYGSWWLVELETQPMIPAEPRDPEGGAYVRIDNKVIVARNWQAVAYQRRQRGALSTVVYNERALVLSAVLDNGFPSFVEDASIERPKLR